MDGPWYGSRAWGRTGASRRMATAQAGLSRGQGTAGLERPTAGCSFWWFGGREEVWPAGDVTPTRLSFSLGVHLAV